MEFRDLKAQYSHLEEKINDEVSKVLKAGHYIMGPEVRELEEQLAKYVGTKYCITCANGTDALQLALMAWGIGKGDAVFVPDFTFFASAEVVSLVGAEPVFVDIDLDTFNMSVDSLQMQIERVVNEGKLVPRVIIGVDLFGQPADYDAICAIAKKYNMYVLEDAAQGFGGSINGKKACSFGDIATTSFFPAKPLGCYGDGGAIFTNDEAWCELIKSYRVHGKGQNKYDNVRIGLNSRLDTIQAAILKVKLEAFENYELDDVNKKAEYYTKGLKEWVKTPVVKSGMLSSWAQYTLLLDSNEQRNQLKAFLAEKNIPSMVYYERPLHKQVAFEGIKSEDDWYQNTIEACDKVLSLPMHPYLKEEDMDYVIDAVVEFLKK